MSGLNTILIIELRFVVFSYKHLATFAHKVKLNTLLTIITFLLFILTTYLIFKGRIFKNTSIPSSYIAIAFALKLLVIVAFVNYLNSHSEYDLKRDHESYLNDSNVLNSVYHKDPKAYFKLLLGLDNSDETR